MNSLVFRFIAAIAMRAARLAYVMCWVAVSCARGQSYVNFEGQQTRPICLSPDGSRLFAVNTPDGRLSVFDVSNPANAVPILVREIPVGVEPVSVNVRSNDEAWVVNEVSDSVSIVSVASGAVVATLACKDEPADVVFAAGRAFVSCARNNLVRVFDLATRAEIATVPLAGLDPRSLAVSADGSKVYAAFKLSGNRTTLLPASLAPAPPAPTNLSLPVPPQVGLIVAADDPRLSPAPNLPDNDIAEISTAALTVTRYFNGVGTINFHIAVRPLSDELWVANTEARNLVRFEPNQKGHSVDNRVTRVATGTATVTAFDLNPGVNYALFPNPAAAATALAQPTAIAFVPDGSAFWLAAFASDRVAKIDADSGAVLARVETGPTTGAAADSRNKRGPRGLAYRHATQRLYVANRIANTISIISTASESVVAEIPVGSFDPTPAVIRQGRGFLYDARLSGNGTQSCASCHIDGDRDELAWDLGDPGGSMQTVTTIFDIFTMHPMKGPMATQTLRGLSFMTPLHWRGDRANVQAFNPAFAALLGGTQLSTADINAFRDFINTIVFEPNPNLNLDRTMPAFFPPGDPNPGDPNAGQFTFQNEDFAPSLRCNTCHFLPTGTNRAINSAATLFQNQALKTPHLRNAWQKRHFVRSASTISLSGFGLVHDGMEPDFESFFSRDFFRTFKNDATRKRNLAAFMQCFDTGTAPSVGYTRTLQAATLTVGAADWTLLESQAASGTSSDLVVRIAASGGRQSFFYRPGMGDYLSDQTGVGPLTRAQLESLIAGGTTATVMGVPLGSGQRLGVDRNGNAVLDGDEPMPALDLSLATSVPHLTWPAADSMLVLECSDTLADGDWHVVTEPRNISGVSVHVFDPTTATQRFYRLRRP